MNAQANTLALVIDDDIIHVTPHPDHEYTATSDRVAVGYGVTPANIRKTLERHRDELIAGKHYYVEVTRVRPRTPTAEELAQLEKMTGGMFCAANLSPRVTNSHAGNFQRKTTIWTKRGIVRLGFFIRSERAKRFRDIAEDLVLRGLNGAYAARPAFDPVADCDARIASFAIKTKRDLGVYEGLIALRSRLADGQARATGRTTSPATAAVDVVEAVTEGRDEAFEVPFSRLSQVAAAYRLGGLRPRSPREAARPSFQSAAGKVLRRLLDDKTFPAHGRLWQVRKLCRARGSVYLFEPAEAIRDT